MSSTRRRLLMRHPVVVDIGCGCRRSKLSSFFSFSSFSKPKYRKASDPSYTTTTTTSSPWETTATTTTSLHEDTSSPSMVYSDADGRRRRPGNARRRREKKRGGGRVAGESVAVVKESSEPYLDFKESMLQMIIEMEIYGWDELNDLLHQLLSLNSPDNHHLILRAFTDIWDGVLSVN